MATTSPNTIQITDRLGAQVEIQTAPASTFVKYAREIPQMLLDGADLSRLGILTLNDPAVRSLQPTLTFNQPLPLGTGGPQVTIGAGAGISFQVIAPMPEAPLLFSPDFFGDNIQIPAAQCYLNLGINGSLSAGLQTPVGSAFSFGITAGAELRIDSYRPFPLGDPPVTIIEALRVSTSELVIPTDADDLRAMPAGVIVTVAGKGALAVSATANLLAVTNPLATLALPSPIPTLAVTQGGSVTVDASWQIDTEYQVRVQKVDARRVRLGWYRKHGSDFDISATASAGISAGTQNADLFSRIIGVISSNAAADMAELERAGLDPEIRGSIDAAVRAAVNRKLELALTAEFGSLRADDAAFLYEVDLDSLGDDVNAAVHQALAGNLTGLSSPLAGITPIRSIVARTVASQVSLKINLLGIFNFGSVSRLALDGTVTFTPSTGELVIADSATAERIQTEAVNFGANEEKLRQVIAESFLITAAYRVSGAVISPPELTCSHVFFHLDNHTSLDEMKRISLAAAALGLGPFHLPADISDFGRTTVLAEARYDNELTWALFLENGSPRPTEEYEAQGRRAVRLLVPPDGDDVFRLGPATNDALWKQMQDVGPANFTQLMPQLQADGVRPDYLVISWWAETMRSTAQLLAAMNRRNDDADFESMRHDLAAHLKDVASKAHELFGSPWGLVAMFLVSGSQASVSMQVTGPRFVFSAERALAATS
jgi:hypothetical protein